MIKNRKLFTAIFRYRNLSGLSNLKGKSEVKTEANFSTSLSASSISSSSADFVATPPLFFHASNLEEAKTLMQSVFIRLQKTKNLDVALFVREFKEQEEKTFRDFVAISADDIALYVFNNDELGGYEDDSFSAYCLSSRSLKHLDFDFKDNQTYLSWSLSCGVNASWQQKYIQGFYLSNNDSDLNNLAISDSNFSAGSVSGAGGVSAELDKQLSNFTGIKIISLDKFFLEKDFISGLSNNAENKDFQNATS